MKGKEKTRLNLIYGIKEVGGGNYNEGFYDALKLADDTFRLAINKRLIQANEKEDHIAKPYLIGLKDKDLS